MNFKTVTLLAILVIASASHVAGDTKMEKSEEERINDINRLIAEKGYRWKAGRTSMSSLTEEEKAILEYSKDIPEDEWLKLPIISAPPGVFFPDSFDWRTEGGVTAVKNQNDPQLCGACWAFSTVAQLESHILIYDDREVSLSEQQVISCNRRGDDCDGGLFFSAYELFMSPGVVLDGCIPYEASDDIECIQDQCSVYGRISGFSRVAPDEESIKYALMEYGPIRVSINILDLFYYYVGGYYSIDGTSGTNHAVLLVGWNDNAAGGDGVWIIKNSYGDDWGIDGYGYVLYNDDNILQYATQIDYIPDSIMETGFISPRGGEVWLTGSTRDIAWTCEDSTVDHFEAVFYDGPAYHSIDNDIDGSERKLSWTLPSSSSTACRIQIKAFNAGDSLLAGSISESFAIMDSRTEWSSGGVSLSGTGNLCSSIGICGDQEGNTYVSWMELPNIYVQKLDRDGTLKWPSGGAVACDYYSNKSITKIVPDDAGGIIIAWKDMRDVANGEIYAQRIDSSGTRQWGTSGKAVAHIAMLGEFTEGSFKDFDITTDGNNGVIILFEHNVVTKYSLYAVRMDISGTHLWGSGLSHAIAVSDTSGTISNHDIMTDGSGGAFITWADDRSGHYELFAQKVSSDGSVRWAGNGITVCSTNAQKYNQKLISDGFSGAILAWQEYRDDQYNFYAQRFNSSGTMLWTTDGLLVAPGVDNASPSFSGYDITSNGSGGIIAIWDDAYDEYGVESRELDDIFAQMVDSSGTLEWGNGGLIISAALEDQNNPVVMHDGSGGAILAWLDNRDSITRDLFMQSLTPSGESRWFNNGEPLCDHPADQKNLIMTKNCNATIAAAWLDDREDHYSIYVQKISEGSSSAPACNVTWDIIDSGTGETTGNDFLRGCPRGDWEALQLTLDFTSGPMNASDISIAGDGKYRFWDSTEADSAALSSNGYVTTLTSDCLTMSFNQACEFCPEKTMWVLLDNVVIAEISGLDIRGCDVTNDGKVNLSDLPFLGNTYNKSRGDEGYNDCLDFTHDGKVDNAEYALFSSHYSHSKPSSSSMPLADLAIFSDVEVGLTFQSGSKSAAAHDAIVDVSLDNSRGITDFMICLELKDPSLAFGGWLPEAGREDNVLVSRIDRGGRRYVYIASFDYESGSDGKIAIGSIVLSAPDLSVKASDIEVAFGEVLDEEGNLRYMDSYEIGEDVPSYNDFLGNNYPNPFNPSTEIRFSIARDSHVRLSIYNIAGQLIRTLVDEDMMSSEYSVRWDGRNNQGRPVSSGVYFYRLDTGHYSRSKKMVLLR